jgi:DNA modification methylase
MTIAQPLARFAIPIADLTPDPANARRHGEKNLDAIKASLASFGQRKPIVVQRDGMIVRAGNGTLAAAKALGWEEIAAVVIDDDNATASQFAIADNRTGELAEWDDETLGALLDGMDEPIRELLAFDDGDMRQLLGRLEPDEVTEDTAPEPPADPVTKTGDLIMLGDHRLLCGDSTNADDVARLMGGEAAEMMVTDPPYGVEYDPNRRNHNPGRKQAAIKNDDRADWGEAFALFAGDVAYVWHAAAYTAEAAAALDGIGFSRRAMIVWSKPSFASLAYGRNNDQVEKLGLYHWSHEPCWYVIREGGAARWVGGKAQSTVWDIESPQHSEDHPTQKPVECMARPIRNHMGDVYEPFCGCGTTLIAAEQLGRKCYGMEISPAYCDVIVQRWENLTGKQAVRS